MGSGLARLWLVGGWYALGCTGCWALDWENIEEASEESPAEKACASPWEASGSVQAGATAIDYSGGRVKVTAVHKLDVDAIEDGCLGRFEVTVALAQGQCPLNLVFMGKNGALGGLVEARLTADSACPGFLDAVEGTYTSVGGFAPWIIEGLPGTVPEHGVRALCQPGVRLRFAALPFRLYRSNPPAAELTVHLEGLELRGDLLSRGDASARCFEASGCGTGWHDGGDGWCVEAGRCSPGHSRLPTGGCAP